MTSECRGTPYFRRCDRESAGFETRDFVKGKLGGLPENDASAKTWYCTSIGTRGITHTTLHCILIRCLNDDTNTRKKRQSVEKHSKR